MSTSRLIDCVESEAHIVIVSELHRLVRRVPSMPPDYCDAVRASLEDVAEVILLERLRRAPDGHVANLWSVFAPTKRAGMNDRAPDG